MTCKKCLYDNRIPNITFDDRGICGYCQEYERLEKEYPTGREGMGKLQAIVEEIKKEGKGKKYDCVIGVSGGCDSSYLLHLAVKEWGLRPLAVNVDNGWDTKTAKSNLKKVTSKLGVDLKTYKAERKEFNDIARAFLYASVPEIDAHSDLALASLWVKACQENKIKYFLIGHSLRTEGMFPIGWFYFDGKYIADVYGQPFKTFPNLTFWKMIGNIFSGVKQIRPIWYLDYNKEEIKKMLADEYGWQWYGGHHHENKFTWFHHWYNWKKFNIDQRFVEYSAMLRAGLIKRKDAELQVNIPYEIDPEIVEEVRRKLKISKKDFGEIMRAIPRTYKDFKSYKFYFRILRPFFYLAMKMNLVPKSFYLKYCF